MEHFILLKGIIASLSADYINGVGGSPLKFVTAKLINVKFIFHFVEKYRQGVNWNNTFTRNNLSFCNVVSKNIGWKSFQTKTLSASFWILMIYMRIDKRSITFTITLSHGVIWINFCPSPWHNSISVSRSPKKILSTLIKVLIDP